MSTSLKRWHDWLTVPPRPGDVLWARRYPEGEGPFVATVAEDLSGLVVQVRGWMLPWPFVTRYELIEHAPTVPDSLNYWPCDDALAPVVDTVSAMNFETVDGVFASLPGHLGNAISLATWHGQTPTLAAWATEPAITVRFWFQPDLTTWYSQHGTFSTAVIEGPGWRFNVDNGQPIFRVWQAAGQILWLLSPNQVPEGWHHYLLRAVLGGSSDFFIDGARVATVDTSAWTFRQGNSFVSLYPFSFNTPYPAPINLIDDIKLWTRALTDTEIALDFAGPGGAQAAGISAAAQAAIAKATASYVLPSRPKWLDPIRTAPDVDQVCWVRRPPMDCKAIQGRWTLDPEPGWILTTGYILPWYFATGWRTSG
jgi:hypothetical protein